MKRTDTSKDEQHRKRFQKMPPLDLGEPALPSTPPHQQKTVAKGSSGPNPSPETRPLVKVDANHTNVAKEGTSFDVNKLNAALTEISNTNLG
jgi:hypothetical protein